jgi:hypothetical protein
MFNTSQQTLTQDDVKEFKKQRLEEVRDYHHSLISNLGIPRTDFNMKMAFYDKQARMVVGIFASEFKKEKGFYFELITRDLEPADPNRTVYRIPYNSSFEEEYEINEKGSYLVPLEELRAIDAQSVAINGQSALLETAKPQNIKQVTAYKAPAPMEDGPYSEMTIRDFMAITTGKPVSAKTWLNELIKSTSK